MAALCSGFLRPVMLLIKEAPGPHGNTLPNRWMQERLAAGPRRAAVVRIALHAVAGERVRRDAPGNGVGEHRARAAAGDHAVYHRKWRKAGARGHQWFAPHRRFEGPNIEYVSDVDEFTGKPGSRFNALFLRATYCSAVTPPTFFVNSISLRSSGAAVLRSYHVKCRCNERRGSGLRRGLWCLSGWRDRRRKRSFRTAGPGSGAENRCGGHRRP